jgi:hypothetical protein
MDRGAVLPAEVIQVHGTGTGRIDVAEPRDDGLFVSPDSSGRLGFEGAHCGADDEECGLATRVDPVPASLTELYAIGEFKNADYPNLIPPGQSVDTIAVPAVLAVYNWPKLPG